jgi:hypothetical protein
MNTGSPSPSNPLHFVTESLDSILVVLEGPGDKTRRPRRPNILLTPPPPRRPPDFKDEKPTPEGPEAPPSP